MGGTRVGWVGLWKCYAVERVAQLIAGPTNAGISLGVGTCAIEQGWEEENFGGERSGGTCKLSIVAWRERWAVSLDVSRTIQKSVAEKDPLTLKLPPAPRRTTEGELPFSSVSKLISDGPDKVSSAARVKLTKTKYRWRVRISNLGGADKTGRPKFELLRLCEFNVAYETKRGETL